MWIAVTTLVAVVILLFLAVVFLLVRKPAATNGSSQNVTTPPPNPNPPPTQPNNTGGGNTGGTNTPPPAATPAKPFLDQWFGWLSITVVLLAVLNIGAATVFWDEWRWFWSSTMFKFAVGIILFMSVFWRKQKWTKTLTFWLVIILVAFGLFEARVLTRDHMRSAKDSVSGWIPKGSGSGPAKTNPVATKPLPKIAPLPQKNSEGKWVIEVPPGSEITWIQLSKLGGNRTMNANFSTDSSDPVVRIYVNHSTKRYSDYPDPTGKGVEMGENAEWLGFQSRDKDRGLTVLLWFVPKTMRR